MALIEMLIRLSHLFLHYKLIKKYYVLQSIYKEVKIMTNENMTTATTGTTEPKKTYRTFEGWRQ